LSNNDSKLECARNGAQLGHKGYKAAVRPRYIYIWAQRRKPESKKQWNLNRITHTMWLPDMDSRDIDWEPLASENIQEHADSPGAHPPAGRCGSPHLLSVHALTPLGRPDVNPFESGAWASTNEI
jgi:hypothetical protein